MPSFARLDRPNRSRPGGCVNTRAPGPNPYQGGAVHSLSKTIRGAWATVTYRNDWTTGVTSGQASTDFGPPIGVRYGTTAIGDTEALAMPSPRELAALRAQIGFLETALARANYAAEHDALTGLANRAAFYTRAGRLVAIPAGPMVVGLIDLDEFKPINDTYGHGVGDAVLRAIAGRLQKQIDALGLVARLGGDEFAVIA